jgi:transcriptional regulator GlxA family with amidase domain/YHS domain-containing protein
MNSDTANPSDRTNEHDDQRTYEVAFVVTPGAELVDIAGPWGVFEYATSLHTGRTPFNLMLVAATTDPIGLSGGMRVVPQRTFADCTAPDIVVVPALSTEQDEELLDWLRTVQRNAIVTISVCNGAFTLAAAGLLDGRTATCHHGSYNALRAMHPQVTVERGVRWIDHGDVATAAGLTSGTDLALRIVHRLLGPDTAEHTATELEHLGNGWRDPSINAVFTESPAPPPGLVRDLICGMTITPAEAITATWDGHDYHFCCAWCRDAFLASPAQYVESA